MTLRHRNHTLDTDLEVWLRKTESVRGERAWTQNALMRAESIVQRVAVWETAPAAPTAGYFRWATVVGVVALIGVAGLYWYPGVSLREAVPNAAAPPATVSTLTAPVLIDNAVGAPSGGGSGAAALSQFLGYKRTGGALRISAYVSRESGTASSSGPIFRIEAYGGPVRLEAEES